MTTDITYRGTVTVTSANGIYPFTFTSPGAYSVDVEAVNAVHVEANVQNQTLNGFNIVVTSEGLHYTPQPVNCSVTPVQVVVTVMGTGAVSATPSIAKLYYLARSGL